MGSTLFDLSEDGQMLTLHGLKARWNTDGTWDSNLEARRTFPECIACHDEKMSPIKPVGVAKWVSAISQNPHLRNETRLRVTAYVAVMLFLEGTIHSDSLTQMYEQDGEVVIPDVHIRISPGQMDEGATDGDFTSERVRYLDLTLHVMRGDHSQFEAVNTPHLTMMAAR